MLQALHCPMRLRVPWNRLIGGRQPLTTHSASIDRINTAEGEGLAGVDARFAEFLETAGTPLAVALDQSQEPMSRLATALETYNSTPVVLARRDTTAAVAIDAVSTAACATDRRWRWGDTEAAEPEAPARTMHVIVDNPDDISTNVNVNPVITQ